MKKLCYIFCIILLMVHLSCSTNKSSNGFVKDKQFIEAYKNGDYKAVVKSYITFLEKQKEKNPTDEILLTKLSLLSRQEYNDPKPEHVFIAAIVMDDFDTVKDTYPNGIDINKSSIPISYIQLSSYFSGANIFKFLKEKGALTDEKDMSGMTLLQTAVQWGNLEVAKYLIEKENQDVKQLTPDNQSLLILALPSDNLVSFKYLESKGLDPKTTKFQDLNVMFLSAYYGSKNIFEYLLQKDYFNIKDQVTVKEPKNSQSQDISDLPKEPPLENSPEEFVERKLDLLDMVLLNSEKSDFTMYLLEKYPKSFDINKKYEGGASPLFILLSKRVDISVIKKLLELGADVNSSLDNGITPFFYVLLYSNLDLVKAFVEKGAKLDSNAQGIGYPLDFIKTKLPPSKENNEIVNYLISLNAPLSEVTDTNSEKETKEQPKT